ncbi:MAG: hypothetical protein WCE79_02885 [Xanthobacteraceae bacterium]
MFRKTVHPLDLLLAVVSAAVPGAAVWYWLALTRWQPVDFLMGLGYLLVAASTMLLVVGGMIAFAAWFFSPYR